ncbi:MAG: gfo/Idh/MocA family oxidoreductase, partial [Pyrobaculum sp.]
EDHVQIFAQYGESSAIYETNWLTPYKFRKLEITGEQGIFVVDFASDEVYFYGEDGVYRPRLEIVEPLLLQDREFLKAASGAGGEVVSREDIVYTMKFCEAATLSIKTRKVLHLDDL